MYPDDSHPPEAGSIGHQLADVLESITDAFYALDRDWRFAYLNRAAGRLLARPRGSLLGKVVWDEFPEAAGTAFDREYRRALAEDVTVRFEEYYPPLGAWFGVRAYPTPAGLSVYFQKLDVSELKETQDALRRSEERYRSLVTATSSIVWVTDGAGLITAENPSWEEFTGQSPAQYLGWGWLDAIHPDDRARTAAAWKESVAAKALYETEYRLIRRDGSYRHVAVRGTPMLDAGGAVREWIGTCADVTKRHEAEEALRAAKEEAEQASRAKDEFIAVLSHELRTPLTPVLIAASMMESHPGLPADLRDDVRLIRRNVELESRLIGDLLDMTRIVKGKLDLDLEVVDVHMLIRLAIDICQREEAVRLTTDLAARHHHVWGDSTRLQQVFWNLINNAQKFTDPETGTIAVRSSDAPGGRVCIEVSDTGAGIDPAVLPHLFEAFEQGDVRARRAFAGLGLGLAISRRLVDAHGGTIHAASAGKGRGATFTVELPTVAPAPSLPPAAAPAPPAAGAGAGPLSILLVEDSEPTQRILGRLLSGLGHRVSAAGSVASALALCNQREFDILLSDLGLPDGSGLDLMRRVRDRYEGRAIALTGYGMESDVRACLDAGFAAHLTKPINPDALTATIAALAAGLAG